MHGEGKHHILTNRIKYKEDKHTTWMEGGVTQPCHVSILIHKPSKTHREGKPMGKMNVVLFDAHHAY